MTWPVEATPSNVKLGPGKIYYAPLGTAEPTLGSATLPSQWQAVGYTEDGSEVQINQDTADIEVAEEVDPIDNLVTKRTSTFVFEASEATKKNLLMISGGGAANTNDGTAFDRLGLRGHADDHQPPRAARSSPAARSTSPARRHRTRRRCRRRWRSSSPTPRPSRSSSSPMVV
jgi:hypothetical protein